MKADINININEETFTMLSKERLDLKEIKMIGTIKESGIAIKVEEKQTEEPCYDKNGQLIENQTIITQVSEEETIFLQMDEEEAEEFYNKYLKVQELLDFYKGLDYETDRNIDKIKFYLSKMIKPKEGSYKERRHPDLIAINYVFSAIDFFLASLATTPSIAVIDTILGILMFINGSSFIVNTNGIKEVIEKSKISEEEKEKLIKSITDKGLSKNQIENSKVYYYAKGKLN